MIKLNTKESRKINTLLLGGARSGKSGFAERLAKEHNVNDSGDVLFVATAQAYDEEMIYRIKKHKEDRPEGWQTLEVDRGVGEAIRNNIGNSSVVLIDCITLLVTNLLCSHLVKKADEINEKLLEEEINVEIEEMIAVINKLDASFIIVTNEVGEGIVPDNKMSRVYRDMLGRANQKLAQAVDKVYLMVAGIPLEIK